MKKSTLFVSVILIFAILCSFLLIACNKEQPIESEDAKNTFFYAFETLDIEPNVRIFSELAETTTDGTRDVSILYETQGEYTNIVRHIESINTTYSSVSKMKHIISTNNYAGKASDDNFYNMTKRVDDYYENGRYDAKNSTHSRKYYMLSAQDFIAKLSNDPAQSSILFNGSLLTSKVLSTSTNLTFEGSGTKTQKKIIAKGQASTVESSFFLSNTYIYTFEITLEIENKKIKSFHISYDISKNDDSNYGKGIILAKVEYDTKNLKLPALSEFNPVPTL